MADTVCNFLAEPGDKGKIDSVKRLKASLYSRIGSCLFLRYTSIFDVYALLRFLSLRRIVSNSGILLSIFAPLRTFPQSVGRMLVYNVDKVVLYFIYS